MFPNGGWCPWCGGGGGGGGFLGGFLMLVFGLLVLAGIVLLVVWAAREFGRSGGERYGPQDSERMQPPPLGGAPHVQDDAVTIARERYARGEITREELEDIISTLQRPR